MRDVNGLNRRAFFAAGAASVLHAKSLSTIGAQLYTVRSIAPDRPLETLRGVEAIGYREVELVRAWMDKIWDSLKQTSLKPVSLHLDTPYFMEERDKLPAALEDARQRGFRFVVCPYIAPKDRGGVDVMKRLAGTLNTSGEKCRAMGLKLCYHNHAFEFAPAGGGTLLDVLLENTDPKLVALELDVMWVKVGGQDPASLIRRHRGRIDLMHLKDVDKSVAPQFNETVPKSAFKEAGSGVIDFAAVLKAAAAAGVKHYFVEQDQTPGDPLASLRQSYGYLKKLKF
jgi:sugar phosphate isomerase/epimerase